jgi:hypothetical protein
MYCNFYARSADNRSRSFEWIYPIADHAHSEGTEFTMVFIGRSDVFHSMNIACYPFQKAQSDPRTSRWSPPINLHIQEDREIERSALSMNPPWVAALGKLLAAFQWRQISRKQGLMIVFTDSACSSVKFHAGGGNRIRLGSSVGSGKMQAWSRTDTSHWRP